MFEMHWMPLDEEHPEWGQASLLPWDCEIFGFPIADYTLGDVRAIWQSHEAWQRAFDDWMFRNQVELVACSICSDDVRACQLLPELGFRYVDYTFTITQPHLQDFKNPPFRHAVRLAQPEDQAEVERIAEHAFRFGRYHIDPRFPKQDADRRYRIWLRNAYATLGPKSVMIVLGEVGHLKGFCHVNLEGNVAHITMIAIDLALQHGTAGMELCVGVVEELQKRGIRKMRGKISASNLGILNIAAYFGFRFSQPMAAYHWHSPNAKHLLPLEEALQ